MTGRRTRDGSSALPGPRAIAEVLAELLEERGLDADVARAAVLEAWPGVVGPQIAAVTLPRLLAEDGTMVVGVRTHAWMTELALMERALVAKLNAGRPQAPVKRIRWELARGA
jgi:predicted nucleic acid-binding Zn ribbon protein